MTFRMGENETKIDFVLIRKNTDGLCEMRRKYLGNFNKH